jgi:hypothetical protein
VQFITSVTGNMVSVSFAVAAADLLADDQQAFEEVVR